MALELPVSALAAALLLAACTATTATHTPTAPAHVRTRAADPSSTSIVWSTAVERGAASFPQRSWLARTLSAADTVLVVLAPGTLSFTDPHGRRVTEIEVPEHSSAALDPVRRVVWLHGDGKLAAIDLLADELRVEVLAERLPHEGLAVQHTPAPVVAPDVLVGLDAADEPETEYTLLDWSSASPAIERIVVDEDGVASSRRSSATSNAEWFTARAERVAWRPTFASELHGRHPACPYANGDLFCQPFGSSDAWLVGLREEMGDVMHVEVLLYDEHHAAWAVPREGVAMKDLDWTATPDQAIEVQLAFDLDGRVYVTDSHVCDLDEGCRTLADEFLGFLGGTVRLDPSG